jgi:hypothetical protein
MINIANSVASRTPLEAALQPVKLVESIGQRGCYIGSRF